MTFDLFSEFVDLNEVKFSARRQDFKLEMNALLEKAVEGLKGARAGGHIPAAAGQVKRKDLQKFKEKILETLKGC